MKKHSIDFKKYDLVIEMHANAGAKDTQGNGVTTGIEIWVTPNKKEISLENTICQKIATLGLKNRGVKRQNFFVISQINAQNVPCCLIENGFIDDQDDMKIITQNMDLYAKTLANAIAEYYSLKGSVNNNSHLYQIGQTVRFSTYYKSSTASINEAILAKNMKKDTGVITKIIEGVRNPYLLDDGLCYVNDGDICEVIENKTEALPEDFIKEEATFTCTVDEGIHILESPSLNGKRTGLFYHKGESVNYDGYVRREGYVWISWISKATGTRRYMAAGELNKQGVNIKPYGTFH